MNKTDSDEKNVERCEVCGSILGVNIDCETQPCAACAGANTVKDE